MSILNTNQKKDQEGVEWVLNAPETAVNIMNKVDFQDSDVFNKLNQMC